MQEDPNIKAPKKKLAKKPAKTTTTRAKKEKPETHVVKKVIGGYKTVKTTGLHGAGGLPKTVYQIAMEDDDDTLNYDSILQWYQQLEELYNARDSQIMVRAETELGWRTFKSYSEAIRVIHDMEDYFGNGVSFEEKFDRFYWAEITVMDRLE